MSIIVPNCQHCDEQQFRTLACVHYTIFSVVKSDLFVRALLLDCILVTEKTTRTPCVHLVIYTNDIAAARVELWSSSTNAKYAETSSTNYILYEKQRKV